MALGSGRVRLGELLALADDFLDRQNRFRDECRQVVEDTLSEVEEQSSGKDLNDIAQYEALQSDMRLQWHEVDCAIDDLISLAGNRVHQFVTSAEAQIGDYERRSRHQEGRKAFANPAASKGG